MAGETVNHPAHYVGADNPYEAIKVIEAWGLGFCLGNAVKYISRAGKKTNTSQIEDLQKARWYIDRRIQQLEKQQQGTVVGKVIIKPLSRIETADGTLYATEVDGAVIHSRKPVTAQSGEAIAKIIDAAKRHIAGRRNA